MFIRFWLSAPGGRTVLLLHAVFDSYLFDYFVVEHRNGSVQRHFSVNDFDRFVVKEVTRSTKGNREAVARKGRSLVFHQHSALAGWSADEELVTASAVL